MFERRPVAVVRLAAADLAQADIDLPWQSPGEVLGGHLRDSGRALVLATAAGGQAARLSETELTAAINGMELVRSRTETVTVLLTTEALARGLHSDTGLGAHDWVAQRCPWLSSAQVGDVVTVARHGRDPLHAPVWDALLAARMPIRRAAVALRALATVRPHADPEGYEASVRELADVASEPRHSDRDLKRVCEHLLSVVLPEADLDARARSARQMRGVHESSLADGSLTRFVVTCDQEGAGVLRAVLTSPLAAPAPDASGEDSRTAGQRRYDALMTVIRRGVAGADSPPTTPKAKIVVGMAYDALQQALTGVGTTLLGDVLSPETVRRLACDAEIVPQVLGTDREVLEQGRARRLVTRGQRLHLGQRDRGCSFPGCSVPEPWCDAHHVVHWSRHGPTDVDNLALLCGRHHTLVHERDLTASVTATGVRWHT